MTEPTNTSAATSSPWAPFTHAAFTLLWTATLISNIGTWMHDVGAGWLMTTLNPSPAVVTLVQAATTAPIFLLALAAGALADRVDKKRLLIITNAILAVIIGIFTALVFFDFITPLLLIVFTFLIGMGAAFIAPAWQAIVTSLVPKETLQPAIAMNSMGINISRAIGPAVAGFLITAVGVAAPFAVNALSCVAIVVALLFWKPPVRQTDNLPPEPFVGSIITGIRHASNNQALKATLVRALGFFTFASAYWSMLPIVARTVPGGGAELFGFLLTSIGAGAVVGALALARVRRMLGPDMLAAAATVGSALAMILFAVAPNPAIAIGAAFLGGLAWISILTCLNVSAQTSLPNWVRARGLAIFLMVFFGSMSAGSVLWGQIATQTSVATALIVAAIGALIVIPITWRAKLGQSEQLDLTPAMSWPEPVVDSGFNEDPDRGPVLITIEYAIEEHQEGAFLRAIYELSDERFRDGAYDWGVYQDAASPSLWTEWFLVSSWAEHLRQHERTTMADQDIHDKVRLFHIGDDAPVVRHLLAPQRIGDEE